MPEGAKVCGKCGAPLDTDTVTAYNGNSVPQTQPVYTAPAGSGVADTVRNIPAKVKKIDFKALLKNKLVIAAAAVVVLAIVLIIIISSAASGGSEYGVVNEFLPMYDGEQLSFIYNGEVLKTKIEYSDSYYYYDSYYDSQYNDDVSVYGWCTADGLWLVNNNGAVKIADSADSFEISSSAQVVYYMADDALYVYNGKSAKIKEFDGNMYSLKVSPDGSACAWLERDDDYEYHGYVYNGGKPVELGKIDSIVSVSNGGNLIYCTKSGKIGYISAMSGDFEKIKTYSSIDAVSADCSSVLFYDGSSTYMYNLSCSEAVKVSKSGFVSLVVPTRGYYAANNFNSFIGECDNAVYRYTLKSGEYETIKLTSDYSSYILSDDGKNLLYLRDGKLYKVSTVNENSDKITVAKNVISYGCDGQLDNIYYLNDDGELCYSNGREDGSKVVFDSDDVYNFSVNSSGVCVFIYDYDTTESEGTIAYSAKGGDKQKCSGLSSVSVVSSSKYTYALDTDGVLYISDDGKSFKNTKIEINY